MLPYEWSREVSREETGWPSRMAITASYNPTAFWEGVAKDWIWHATGGHYLVYVLDLRAQYSSTDRSHRLGFQWGRKNGAKPLSEAEIKWNSNHIAIHRGRRADNKSDFLRKAEQGLRKQNTMITVTLPCATDTSPCCTERKQCFYLDKPFDTQHATYVFCFATPQYSSISFIIFSIHS